MKNALIAAGVTVLVAVAGVASADVQTKEQQGCLNAINKDASKVARAQAGDVALCIKDAGAGKLGMLTAQQCVAADRKGKLAKATSKTLADEVTRCTPSPDFGYAGGAASNSGAIDEERGLAEDIFGAPLDAAILSSVGAGCQSAVAKSYTKLVQAKLKEFIGCKKKGLAAGSVDSAAALQACMDAILLDPRQKIAKASSKLGSTLAGAKCFASPLAPSMPALFAGVCSGQATSAGALSTCIDVHVECRVCRMLDLVDGLSRDCDVFDDGLANFSCGPAVETCTDGFVNQDESDVDCGGTTCAGCADGLDCVAGVDCASGVCTGNVCQAPTCSDGVANGDETDVDCGGLSCAACADGLDCVDAGDCVSGVCTGNVCQAPTCSDGVANGAETDTDCGGSCPDCPDGGGCLAGSDCQSGVCMVNMCVPAACNDSVQNGSETDVDCGGPSCAPCADGDTCAVASDCQSGVCTGSVCQAPTCIDGVDNGSETDVDCGGSCPDCADGDGCLAGSDCVSGVCTGNVCQAPTCTDGVDNGSETDVDCGGPCPACQNGDACLVAADCLSGVCTGNVCQAPTCSDGVENGTETDVDCGGSCPDCPDGNGCIAGSDCASGVCTGNVCQGPTCADGVDNGSETDVDCGGGTCPACPLGDSCVINGDCANNNCVSGICSCGNQAFTFSINSNSGGLFDSAEWPGGSAVQNGVSGCSVTVARPSGNIDLVGTLGNDFEVLSFAGYSNCFGFGGEDGDGCQADSCPPLGIPQCVARRPSCSAALNGSGSARFFVQCVP